jgi:hypothetical protein
LSATTKSAGSPSACRRSPADACASASERPSTTEKASSDDRVAAVHRRERAEAPLPRGVPDLQAHRRIADLALLRISLSNPSDTARQMPVFPTLAEPSSAICESAVSRAIPV